MSTGTFRALIVEKADKKAPAVATVKDFPRSALPIYEADGDDAVTVSVTHSSLNYKDGLVITGKPGVVKDLVIVPGIDFAGTVLESKNPKFKPGDQVVHTGWGVGERRWGGMSTLASSRGKWLVPLPDGMTPERAMAIGTAGFTAMLCVQALEDAGVTPEWAAGAPILVTGASGGVGSVAVALLAARGFTVTASSGRPELNSYLKALGASEVIDRATLSNEETYRALDKEVYAGVVDAVGGLTLSTAISRTKYGGAVAACGLAGGGDIPKLQVFPFILRNVRLLGVDSVMAAPALRERAWKSLAALLPKEAVDAVTQVVALEEVPKHAEAILKGAVRGRVVVKL